MAVKEVKRDGHIEVKPREFAGLQADTTAWQAANKNFPEGSIYKELDTKKIFQLHDGAWYELP
jgi:hypothetical protein